MANKRTSVLTIEQYTALINLIRTGQGRKLHKHPDVAACLMVQANTGMRIGDIINLRLCDIVKDGGKWRLNLTEDKTDKVRIFKVPDCVYDFVYNYANEHNIARDEVVFPISERRLQRVIATACDILGYENISTHSFRKFSASRVYENSGFDIELTRRYLQHSSVAITQRYLATCDKRMDEAIDKSVALV